MRLISFHALWLAVLFGSATLSAQDLRGRVLDADSLPLPNAAVRWLDARGGATTNSDGEFVLSRPHGAQLLLITHVGYEPDTLRPSGDAPVVARLSRPRTLETVQIEGKAPDTYLAPVEFKTEVITSKELEKAACCDLSGCFSTTSSVQPSVTDIITDTKELTMLGLDGVYTMVLVDNTPSLTSGLNQPYGAAFLPGTFIDRIMVTKGSNSVMQGPEAISGLINVLLRGELDPGPVLVNSYMNSHLEKQVDAIGAREFGPWRMVLAGHTMQPSREVDADGNGFLDMPLITRYSVFNKWTMADEETGESHSIGAKATWEDRSGGQRGYLPERDRGSSTLFGTSIQNRRYEAMHRSEFPLSEESALKLHSAFSIHDQDAWYGTTTYTGAQRTLFADVLYSAELAEAHILTAGIAYRHVDLKEDIRFLRNPLFKTYDGARRSIENIPAVLAEYTMPLFDESATIIAGLRADHHNTFGTIVTPRLFVKYDLDEATIVRASAGTGFRSPYLFAENQALLSSWRDIVVVGPVRAERSISAGLSLTHLFDLSGMPGSVSVDAYRTEFTNQFVADFDHDPSLIVFEHLDGRSNATSIMTEVIIDPAPWLNARASWTFTESREFHRGAWHELPLVPRHRGLFVVTVTPEESSWSATASMELHGSRRMPDTQAFPEEFRLAGRSPSWAMINAQLSRDFSLFEIYAGVENLLDTRQANPIINAANPFDRWFEPTFVWGPVKGRILYVGLRATISAW